MLNKVKLTVPETSPIGQEIAAFNAWYLSAKPGSFYIYYKGENLTENILASTIKNKVWELALEGKIYLFRKLIIREKIFSEYHFFAYKVREKLPRLVPKPNER